MFCKFSLWEGIIADPAVNHDIWAFGQMGVHFTVLHLLLAVLAGHFDLRYEFPCYIGGLAGDICAPTAWAMPVLGNYVVEALRAEDFGAAAADDC